MKTLLILSLFLLAGPASAAQPAIPDISKSVSEFSRDADELNESMEKIKGLGNKCAAEVQGSGFKAMFASKEDVANAVKGAADLREIVKAGKAELANFESILVEVKNLLKAPPKGSESTDSCGLAGSLSLYEELEGKADDAATKLVVRGDKISARLAGAESAMNKRQVELVKLLDCGPSKNPDNPKLVESVKAKLGELKSSASKIEKAVDTYKANATSSKLAIAEKMKTCPSMEAKKGADKPIVDEAKADEKKQAEAERRKKEAETAAKGKPKPEPIVKVNDGRTTASKDPAPLSEDKGSAKDRVKVLSSSLGMKEEEAKQVEAAIISRNNPAMSKKLLDQADAFAAANGLKPARVSGTDNVCGERCVALLRAQAYSSQAGYAGQYSATASANNSYYITLIQHARTVKPKVLGSMP